jgi:hypothetical protein
MPSTPTHPTSHIAQLNDQFRRSAGRLTIPSTIPGILVLSAGIHTLPSTEIADIVEQVRNFQAFTPDNDPYGEHDFGALDIVGLGKVFWKIDYYDPSLTCGSEDPTDLRRTQRVLTVMLAYEY